MSVPEFTAARLTEITSHYQIERVDYVAATVGLDTFVSDAEIVEIEEAAYNGLTDHELDILIETLPEATPQCPAVSATDIADTNFTDRSRHFVGNIEGYTLGEVQVGYIALQATRLHLAVPMTLLLSARSINSDLQIYKRMLKARIDPDETGQISLFHSELPINPADVSTLSHAVLRLEQFNTALGGNKSAETS